MDFLCVFGSGVRLSPLLLSPGNMSSALIAYKTNFRKLLSLEVVQAVAMALSEELNVLVLWLLVEREGAKLDAGRCISAANSP